ncbi:carbon-nitrogen hydrolase family protein [Actinophytocola xanthii]|uniref:Hydrolase n=1 Tax=Actinophytocola xanthii TaxID=1912961 RepID=A0A1Q8CP24_9PSEU|nr:carbon-nitrogen hydrolase family protein [Actinophytocola xanthii]OLF16112.1 hydrolase [Actinophytocola xanthii]
MRVALSQITSTGSPVENLGLVRSSVERAAGEGASVVLFPEATMACFGTSLAPLAEPIDGPWATSVAEIAAEHDVLVVAGMFTPSPDGRVFNTLLATGRGQHVGYDKIHLFDAFGFAESRTVAPGSELVTVTLDEAVLGLATCYDIRFPELFTRLADRGASAVLLGASWGAGPGKLAQWELLVRARALDSTCWVVACGQADPAAGGGTAHGRAPTGIGFSTVADPSGEVAAQLGADPDLLLVDLDLPLVEKTRAAIPVLANRRL